jgi:NitT/TauT family transport system permease protein
VSTARLAAARTVTPAVVVGGAFFALWEGVVRIFDIRPVLLVAPSQIIARFTDNVGLIWDATKVTGANALVGLVVGTVLGVAMAFLLMSFKLLDEIVSPLSIAVNALPIFVVVSVLNNMYPATSQMPRRLMVVIVVYFVVLVNVARGLREVQPTHVELMRSCAAGRWDLLRKVRIPNAVPFLFTALKVAAPLAVITAFVAEYFGGTQTGLGNKITSSFSTSKKAEGWAYVAAACLLGMAFYLISIAIETVSTTRGAAHRQREST